MSPVSLRRYRAERLLRREFRGLRARVLHSVSARLRVTGIELDRADLEAAYALAWQGLYAAVLEGELIESPASWLVLVTFRRAVEEYRARRRTAPGLEPGGAWQSGDLAGDLDTRIRLEDLLEGLSRLSERERQAATLCYLQGLSRAEAAAQMGIGEGRMRKLMEGRGAGDPGVSGKIGALARTIDEGGWCDSQGSLMRALAYGILDRDGERYRQALVHHRRCPSCRAYVLALRGLAVALPPALLPGARLVLAGLAGGASRARTAVAHLAQRGSGAGGSRAPVVGGASGAGGGLALAGPFGAKLAVGCLMVIGVGAGCIGLGASHDQGPVPGVAHVARQVRRALARETAVVAGGRTPAPSDASLARAPAGASRAAVVREFGPEQALAAAAGSGGAAARAPGLVGRRPARPAANPPTAPRATLAAVGGSPAARAVAREFAP